MQTVTAGLVLKEVKVGEADRIITILTPGQGIISASARGSLRLKNKLFSACGLFCYSEFALTAGRNTWFVDEAHVKQVFYGLSQSIEGMALAMYLAELAICLAPQGGEEADRQLRLLLNSIYLISEHKKPLLHIKTVYELRAMAESGYMPDLLCCKKCGRYEDDWVYFDTKTGILLCEECAKKESRRPNLDGGALVALRHICLVEDKKVFSFQLSEPSMKLLGAAAESYVQRNTDTKIKTLDFWKSIST